MNNPIPLSAGKTITIGRKASCDVVIDSLLISSTHCRVSFVHHTGTPAVATVSDCSKNGTWVARSSAKGLSKASGSSSKVPTSQKLPKGVTQDMHADDIIMLLAPNHKQNSKYRYKLLCTKNGKYFLRRMCGLQTSTDGAVAGTKRPAKETAKGMNSLKRARSDGEKYTGTKATITASDSDIHTKAPLSEEEEDRERCPSCRKLFPISVLPTHCPACQGAGIVRSKSTLGPSPKDDRPGASVSMEECPNCQKILPVTELPYHVESCMGNEMGSGSESYGECPYCSAILPVTSLVEHSPRCREGRLPKIAKVFSISDEEIVEIDGYKRPLSTSYSKRGISNDTLHCAVAGTPGDGVVELEQCGFCLKDFPVCAMPAHYSECRSKFKVHSIMQADCFRMSNVTNLCVMQSNVHASSVPLTGNSHPVMPILLSCTLTL